MYYLVQFVEDNIYESCSQRDIKGCRQKFCLAKWQLDKNFYPAKILASGTKSIVKNLVANLNNGLPKVLLSDVSKLLAQISNKSYAEHISTEENFTDNIVTDSNLVEYMIGNTHPITEIDVLKEGDVINNIENENPVRDNRACDTYVPCENDLREGNLSRKDNSMANNIKSVSVENYIACDKCSELIDEVHFASHNLHHQGRLTYVTLVLF